MCTLVTVTLARMIDGGWRERLEAACAVRLPGSISAQLASAMSHQRERARRVAGLTEDFISGAPPIRWESPR